MDRKAYQSLKDVIKNNKDLVKGLDLLKVQALSKAVWDARQIEIDELENDFAQIKTKLYEFGLKQLHNERSLFDKEGEIETKDDLLACKDDELIEKDLELENRDEEMYLMSEDMREQRKANAELFDETVRNFLITSIYQINI